MKFTESGREKEVPRLSILFDEEDPLRFALRLRAAMLSRERTKLRIRLQHFVDSRPELAPSPLADSTLHRLHCKTVSFRSREEAVSVMQMAAHAKHQAALGLGRSNPLTAARTLAAQLRIRPRSRLDVLRVAELKAGLDHQRSQLLHGLGKMGARTPTHASPPAPLTAAGAKALQKAEKAWQALIPDVSTSTQRIEEENELVVRELLEAEACHTPCFSLLVAEVADLHEAALREASLDHLAVRKPEKFEGLLHAASLQGLLQPLRHRPSAAVQAAPADGFDFMRSAQAVTMSAWLGEPATVNIMLAVAQSWEETVGDQLLCPTAAPAAASAAADSVSHDSALELSEYREHLRGHMRRVARQVSDAWPREVRNTVSDQLASSGRDARFNLLVPSWEAYLASPTHSLMTLVHCHMADKLRTFALQSLRGLVETTDSFIPEVAAGRQAVHDLASLDVQPLLRLTARAEEGQERQWASFPMAMHVKRGWSLLDERALQAQANDAAREAAWAAYVADKEAAAQGKQDTPRSEETARGAHDDASSLIDEGSPHGPDDMHVQGVVPADADRSGIVEVVAAALTGRVVGTDPTMDEVQRMFMKVIPSIVKTVTSVTSLPEQCLALASSPSGATPILPVQDEEEPSHAATVDAAIVDTETKVARNLADAFLPAQRLLSEYQAYAWLLSIDLAPFVSELGSLSPPASFQELLSEATRYQTIGQELARISLDVVACGLFLVDVSSIKAELTRKAETVKTAILHAALRVLREQVSALHDAYIDHQSHFLVVPQTEHELNQLRGFIHDSKAVLARLNAEADSLCGELDALEKFSMKIPSDAFEEVMGLKALPQQVDEAMSDCLYGIESQKEAMVKALAQQQSAFDRAISGLEDRIERFKNVEDTTDLVRITSEAQDIDSALREAAAQAHDFHERQEALGFVKTDYSVLDELVAGCESFMRLWSCVADFEASRTSWLTGPFSDLQADKVDAAITEWWSLSGKLTRQFEESHPNVSAVAASLRVKTAEFKTLMPFVKCLASPALKWWHWDEISDAVGKPIENDADLTLQRLLDEGVRDFMADIEDISVKAEKEHALVLQLDAMQQEWEDIAVEVKAHKNTGTYIIGGIDDIEQVLDDHLVKTQTMMGSPYVHHVKDKAAAWERTLSYISEVLEEWLRLQRTWMYLEPIFASDDINRQMPAEGRRFANIDRMYRGALAETVDSPGLLQVSRRRELAGAFAEANAALDKIQKNLNDYLETKRQAFPRFYFLSNDGLLEILSQTKDPRTVQRHLDKCFEGMAKISFAEQLDGDEGDLRILQMISVEGERIDLAVAVDPTAPENVGNVELWLGKLEKAMRLTVKAFIQKALPAYQATPRAEWVLQHPAQAVLNVGQLFWTRGAEEAMDSSGNQGLKAFLETLNGQLTAIVHLVRGQLSKLHRITMGALCVVDVHARDVIDSMVAAGVQSKNEFAWMSQLRYYWEEKEDVWGRYGGDPWNLLPRIVNATQMYGYEYLGNSSRLVITPLTDRCYRTLMGAVSLMYGGAPAGPAGTGKTETTKDLAKAMAIQCVVYNCSDQLDVAAMAKFFKGLAASGAWACFDEFNRINLEVLSVVAQQIQCIVDAKRRAAKSFDFEGVRLALNPDANCFITMNPGYAGRTELPDNLKALFRPCAMMVPDYALIAEIKLYSFGFEGARVQARKVTQVLRLASEQLSSQKHYDYGMRAVFSILLRAGQLRQELGDSWTEDKIVLRSINDVNVPKFTTNDLPLFSGITQDLFPGVCLPQPDYRLLEWAVRGICEAENLQPKDQFLRSVFQLTETVAVRHGLMVVGETCSGKSTVISTLAKAMSSISHSDDYDAVAVHAMNPKSVKQNQLYGRKDPNTMEWSDGVLAVLYRRCATSQSSKKQWILFDGPVDAVWIEDMNTVLDDNKKLCLSSGEIIKMSPKMTMMFETDSLQEASPATVSRVGMVFMEPNRVGWRPSVQSWMHRLPSALQESAHAAHLESLFEWLVPPCLYFVHKAIPQLCPVSSIELVHSLLDMLWCLLVPAFADPTADPDISLAVPHTDEHAALHPPTCPASLPMPQSKDTGKVIESAFIMALIWSVGAVTPSQGRQAFDHFLRCLLAGEADSSEEFKDFLAKHPTFDAHFTDGGHASRAHDGDVRTLDHLAWRMLDAGVGHLGKAAAGDAAAAGDHDPEESEPATEEQLKNLSGRFHSEPVRGGKLRSTLAKVPQGRLLYDYRVDLSSGSWVEWTKGVPRFEVPAEASFESIMVPNLDSIRSEWLVDALVRNNKHVLCVGETGTGKSVLLSSLLRQRLPGTFMPLLMAFSAQTSANQTQDIIDGKCKKWRKGVYGPPPGRRLVVLVDDLNMPAKETYGAQPPIELLRQWMDYGGWYDREDKEQGFMRVTNTQFVAAMGPPGGGRTTISQRYVRHFNVLGFTPFAAEQLQSIFSTIMAWSCAGFTTSVTAVCQPLVAATIALYTSIASELRPTPAKSHYTFNLRDLSKVFQGMNQASPDIFVDAKQFVRLWGHECLRVFADRLIDEDDTRWFLQNLVLQVKQHLRMDWESEELRGPAPSLLYSHFADDKGHRYSQLDDAGVLKEKMAGFLADYNVMSSAKLSLVLFDNAIEHICRIARVVNLPLGNALLVGVGGSGRKSLTKLAAFISEMQLIQIEISKSYGQGEWREDLKRIMTQAGAAGKPTVFMFSDTQIKSESFVEDLNNILNNGEVPNLFEADELAAVLEDVARAAKKEGVRLEGQDDTYSHFVKRCRQNLHMVLCFSPIGDAFRSRLRQFPSLVNCCTIDWFAPWPEQALRTVAQHFFADLNLPETSRAGVIDVCVAMQRKTADMSQRFLEELGRHYYVTPTSYLELINTFSSLLSDKQASLLSAKARYDNGLTKLAETEDMVDTMKADLEALTPKLQVSQQEAAAMLADIQVASKATSEVKAKVAQEEATASAQNAKANAIKAECESDLAKAIPILKDAQAALKAIDKGDIAIVKKLGKPPAGVRLVMSAVCIMMGLKPARIKNPDGKGKVDDYWSVATKQLLSRSDFLRMLQDYDADNIAPDIVAKMQAEFIPDEAFDPEVIKSSSSAAAGLCRWCHALIKYDGIIKVVGPKRAALAEAEAEAAACTALLAEKQAELAEVEAKMADLQAKLSATEKEKAELEAQVDDCKQRLDRAEQLISGLGGEKVRWVAASQRLADSYSNVVGDMVLAAGVIAYLGAFTSTYRAEAISTWSDMLRSGGIPCAEDFSLRSVLGDEVTIRQWTIDKLPNDAFSVDNAIMLHSSARWPLMIDPQGQANKWVRNTFRGEEFTLHVLKQGSGGTMRSIEGAVQYGHCVLLENLPQEIDPVLEPLLSRQTAKVSGMLVMKLGDNTVQYDPAFKLFMTTKLRNPHFPPETCVKVNLLNFMATEEGLTDQMLGTVVRRLEAKLESQREALVLQDASNRKQLKGIEDTILKLLKESEGDILDDDVLIRTLAESKVTSDQIMEQVEAARSTQQTIEKVRTGYIPVAQRASRLFFCIADLAGVDPMYQYSLEWFTDLFLLATSRADIVPRKPAETARNLNAVFTFSLYENVCRSLFQRHTLLFAFLLASRILVGEGRLPACELQFLLTGSLKLAAEPNPVDGGKGWLSQRAWADIVALKEVPGMRAFVEEEMLPNLQAWQEVFEAEDPMQAVVHLTEGDPPSTQPAPVGSVRRRQVTVEPLNDDARSTLLLFQRLLVLRCLRPDKMIPALQDAIAVAIGKEYIDPPPFDLGKCFADSSACTPLILILSPGADPMAELDKLADKLGQSGTLVKVSLGQGQGPIAAAKIAEAVDRGSWVCLQNCHLAESWLPELERICEEMTPQAVHEDFRLWLTAMPSAAFPVSILQNGVKVTIEPAKGLRANLLGSLASIEEDFFDSCRRPKDFKKLVFGLAFFHAVVRERRKFGPLGWNIPYEFAETDLRISMDQLRIFLDDPSFVDIPFQALAYLVGECNYGGRVTDDKDRRCILNILQDFYTPAILQDGYKFSASGTYYAPKFGSLSTYVEYARSLPLMDAPEVFGLHPNADISTAIAETNDLLRSALSLQPQAASGGGASWESTLADLASNTLESLPPLFDIERVRVQYPVRFEESMNTVLTQELIRFNGLLETVTRSLQDMQRALRGLVVMSPALEALGSSIVQGEVPHAWAAVGYPSLKPFASWVSDLLARLAFFQAWIDGGTPSVFWISGFFFTQSFLTGTRQNYAREHSIPIDEIAFDYQVWTTAASQAHDAALSVGAVVHGLFLQGAGWDEGAVLLRDSTPRELFVSMPYVHLIPKREPDIDPSSHTYACPVYKTSERRGMLSTTGHSTNYVMSVSLPMPPRDTEQKYVKLGVAMLTQLDS